jgi:hypothetical protein
MSHIAELVSQDFLGLDYVGRYARERSLVTNGSDQHNIDVVLHARAHDPAGQDLFADSSSNSADFTNCIYRTEMIFVSAASDRYIGI